MSTVPLVASAADIPRAVRHARNNPSSRVYVARRLAALGAADQIPASWGLTAAAPRYEASEALVAALPALRAQGSLALMEELLAEAQRNGVARQVGVRPEDGVVLYDLVPGAVVPGVTAAGWNASLHPRDRKGKFIEKFGILSLFDGDNFSTPTLRAEATGSFRSGDKDWVTARALSDGKFNGESVKKGETVDVLADRVESAPPRKAKLGDKKEFLDAPSSGKPPEAAKFVPGDLVRPKTSNEDWAVDSYDPDKGIIDAHKVSDPTETAEWDETAVTSSRRKAREGEGTGEPTPPADVPLSDKFGPGDVIKLADGRTATVVGTDEDKGEVLANTADGEGVSVDPSGLTMARRKRREGDGPVEPSKIKDEPAGTITSPKVNTPGADQAKLDAKSETVLDQQLRESLKELGIDPDAPPEAQGIPDGGIDEAGNPVPEADLAAREKLDFEVENYLYEQGIDTEQNQEALSALIDEEVAKGNFDSQSVAQRAIDEIDLPMLSGDEDPLEGLDDGPTPYLPESEDDTSVPGDLFADEDEDFADDDGVTPADDAEARALYENAETARDLIGAWLINNDTEDDPSVLKAEGYERQEVRDILAEYDEMDKAAADAAIDEFLKSEGIELDEVDADYGEFGPDAPEPAENHGIDDNAGDGFEPVGATEGLDEEGYDDAGPANPSVSDDPGIQTAFDEWANLVRSELADSNPNGLDPDKIIEEFAALGRDRAGKRVDWRAKTPDEARTKAAEMWTMPFGEENLALFPIGDPREYGFGGYEVWTTHSDGSKNGGRGAFPDRASAEAFKEETDRLNSDWLETQKGLAGTPADEMTPESPEYLDFEAKVLDAAREAGMTQNQIDAALSGDSDATFMDDMLDGMTPEQVGQVFAQEAADGHWGEPDTSSNAILPEGAPDEAPAGQTAMDKFRAAMGPGETGGDAIKKLDDETLKELAAEPEGPTMQSAMARNELIDRGVMTNPYTEALDKRDAKLPQAMDALQSMFEGGDIPETESDLEAAVDSISDQVGVLSKLDRDKLLEAGRAAMESAGPAPSAPAAAASSPESKAIELSLRNSAANKGIDFGNGIEKRFSNIFETDNPTQGHRDLAKMMTELKLGGKQRKRMRELLDRHYGLTGGDSAKVQAAEVAENLSPDNPLKEALAAKAKDAELEAGGEVGDAFNTEPVNHLGDTGDGRERFEINGIDFYRGADGTWKDGDGTPGVRADIAKRLETAWQDLMDERADDAPAAPDTPESPADLPEAAETPNVGAPEADKAPAGRYTSKQASQLAVGDRLDDRSRVTKVHQVNGKVVAQTKVQGSNAPGVHRWAEGESVRVLREPAPATAPVSGPFADGREAMDAIQDFRGTLPADFKPTGGDHWKLGTAVRYLGYNDEETPAADRKSNTDVALREIDEVLNFGSLTSEQRTQLKAIRDRIAGKA